LAGDRFRHERGIFLQLQVNSLLWNATGILYSFWNLLRILYIRADMKRNRQTNASGRRPRTAGAVTSDLSPVTPSLNGEMFGFYALLEKPWWWWVYGPALDESGSRFTGVFPDRL
jgi:hypothetical protein